MLQTGTPARYWRMPERLLTRCCLYRSQHLSESVTYVLVRKAKNPVAGRSEDFFTLRVIVALICVNTSIKLDGKAALYTTVVNDEGTDGMLTPKLQPVQPASPQFCPK